MNRAHVLFSTILPSLFAGGLLLGSGSGHADAGRERAAWSWSVAPDDSAAPVVAQADPRPRSRSRTPAPPAPPAPPVPGVYAVPPVPPMPPRVYGRGHGHGVSVSVHDGKIEIDGLEELVQDQLERVADVLDSLPDVPPDVRDRVKGRVKSVRSKLGARLGKLRSMDLDKLGSEMERMGDEIERDMEGLDKDLEQLGAKLGKNFAENFGKDFAEKFGKDFAKDFAQGHLPGVHDIDNSDGGDDDADDDDDEDNAPVVLPPSAEADIDPSDMRAAIAGLRNLNLDAGQKDQLSKLRADADRKIADATRELEGMSNRLHDALDDAGASEADIMRQIDQISAKEATIRKARILAWMKVRGMLDKDQRKKVEAAARRHR